MHKIVLIWLSMIASISAAQAQQPTTPCFEIYRNPSAGIAGTLLLNKCTGQAWVLSALVRRDGTHLS
jgi:hypothetical protein